MLTATDGQADIELAEGERPDLIPMDPSPPVVDGLEATCRLKANQHRNQILIIALKAHTMLDDT